MDTNFHNQVAALSEVHRKEMFQTLSRHHDALESLLLQHRGLGAVDAHNDEMTVYLSDAAGQNGRQSAQSRSRGNDAGTASQISANGRQSAQARSRGNDAGTASQISAFAYATDSRPTLVSVTDITEIRGSQVSVATGSKASTRLIAEQSLFHGLKTNARARISKRPTVITVLADDIKRGSVHSNSDKVLSPAYQGNNYAVIRTTAYETIMFVMILVSVILMGVDVDNRANLAIYGYSTHNARVIKLLDCVITAMFSLELVVRCSVQRSKFCSSEDRMWNLLDVATVSVSAAYTLIDSIVEPEEVAKLRAFRILRLFRSLRMVRLVRFLSSVRALVASIFSTLNSLVWVIMLLLIIFYAFSLCFVEGVIDHHTQIHPFNVTAVSQTPLNFHMGSLPRAMLALFQSLTGGLDWGTLLVHLSDVGGFYVGLFLAYIVFAFFAVLNVITGVFCQSAIERAYNDKQIQTMHMIAQRKAFKKKLTELFEDIDGDASGVVEMEELETFLSREDCVAYLEFLGIDPSDAITLFLLLDADGGGEITLEEFIEGCFNLTGSAKAIHIAKLEHDQKMLGDLVCEYNVNVNSKLDRLLAASSKSAGPLIAGPGVQARVDYCL